MRTLRLSLALVLAGALLPACSLLFGSRYSGGTASQQDGGPTGSSDADVDAQTPGDAGTDPDEDGATPSCDADDDGFVADGCDAMGAPLDCDDGDPTVYPGAPPICGDEIDQSCGFTLPLPAGVEVDEVGLFETRGVSSSDVALHRLRVFARGGDVAQVFFQMDDGRGTPVYVAVPLRGGPVENADALGIPFDPTASLYFDALRDPETGDVIYGLFQALGSGAFQSATVVVAPDGSFTELASQSFPSPTPLGEFRMGGQLALVQSETGLVWGVPGVLGDGASRVLTAFATDSERVDSVVSLSAPTSSWRVVSGGSVAAFASGAVAAAWNGSRTSESEASMFGQGESQGRPGLVRFPLGGGVTRTMVLDPSPDDAGNAGIQALVLDCPPTASLASCAPGVDHYDDFYPVPGLGGADPLLTAVELGGTSFGFMYQVDDRLELVIVGIGSDPRARSGAIEMPSPGTRPVIDLDMDFRFRDLAEGAGEVTLAYAYSRHQPGTNAQVFVGGARMCLGFGHD